MQEYLTTLIARERHAAILAFAERQAALRIARGPRRPLAFVVGTALVRAGEWLRRRAPGWAERRQTA